MQINNLDELMEKATPKKVITRVVDMGQKVKYKTNKCPCCDESLYIVGLPQKHNYCSNCGQALEWGK